MLNEYLAEYQSLRADLESILDSAGSGADSSTAADSKLREIKGELMQHTYAFIDRGSVAYAIAQLFADCLGAFEMELRSMPPAQRSSHLNQLQACRDEFARLQRRCLLGASRGHEPSGSTDLKRGNHTLERLNSANIQLGNARKLAEETEEVGASILCNLYMQRESIQRANRHAEQTNASLQESSSLISKMGKWWNGLIG